MKEPYYTQKRPIDTCIPHPTTLQNMIERGLDYKPKTFGDLSITILEARDLPQVKAPTYQEFYEYHHMLFPDVEMKIPSAPFTSPLLARVRF